MENKMWGKDKMWMHTCFVFPDQYTVPRRFDMPFSFSSCCACMKRIARFSGFNDLQMQTDMRKLRYLKKKTERNGNWNHRGSSFYTPHRFVQQLLRELYLNLSFLVLSLQAILWQNQIKSTQLERIVLSVHDESLHCCLNLFAIKFFLLFFLLTFCFLLLGRAAASGILKSKKFTSLHHRWRNTVHDFRTRDARVSKHSKSVVGVTVGQSSQLFAIYIRFFFFLSFFLPLPLFSGVLIWLHLYEIESFAPPPPTHRMLIAPLLCKDQRASNKAMRCPNGFFFFVQA